MGSDKELRIQVFDLLGGGSAHAGFEAVFGDMPLDLRSAKPPGAPHSPWQLLEHLRIAQRDILDYMRDPKHQSPNWPDQYWPVEFGPDGDEAWENSLTAFRADLAALREIALDVGNDLLSSLPNESGHTYVRELLLVADHNSYHLGQAVLVRRLLGAWNA